MTRLPEPLSYEYVDKLLDDTIMFDSHEEERHGSLITRCYGTLKNGFQPTNYVRYAISLHDDDVYRLEEDAEGYTEWYGGHPNYPSQSPTEEELDYYVQYGWLGP